MGREDQLPGASRLDEALKPEVPSQEAPPFRAERAFVVARGPRPPDLRRERRKRAQDWAWAPGRATRAHWIVARRRGAEGEAARATGPRVRRSL